MRNRHDATPRSTPAGPDPSSTRGGVLAALALSVAGLTFLAFVPVLRNEFVNWDDDVLILNNPDFRGFGPRQLRWMFSTMILGNYQPVTWLSFALDYSLWGLRPFGYHLTNLVLHALDAALFFLIARRLLLAGCARAGSRAPDLAAAAAALLYAVHPLRVESVAWAVERKDVLSGFFLFACLLAYLRGIESDTAGRRRRWIGLSLALYTLSLLSKVWGITLPLVLLILDIYPLRRFAAGERRARLIEKLPYAVLAAAAAAVALHAQTTHVSSVARLDLAGRFAQAAFGIVFYLAKIAFPLRLSPIYEHPLPFNPYAPQFIVAALAVILITLGLWLVRKTWPAGLICWAIYLIVLAPVLGFVQVGPQIAADRYTYLAATPWAILAGAGLIRLAARSRRGATAAAAVGAAAILLLGVRTWRQTYVWRDSLTLWTAALAYDPDSWNAHNGLGGICFTRQEYQKAAEHLRRAYETVPHYPGVVINYASCLSYLDRLDEAAALCRGITTMPGIDNSWLLIAANALKKLGRVDEAKPVYERILTTDPDDSVAHYQLAEIALTREDAAAAVAHYIRAVELLEPSVRAGQNDPTTFVDADMFADACIKLITLLPPMGDPAGAEAYRQKLRLVSGR